MRFISARSALGRGSGEGLPSPRKASVSEKGTVPKKHKTPNECYARNCYDIVAHATLLPFGSVLLTFYERPCHQCMNISLGF